MSLIRGMHRSRTTLLFFPGNSLSELSPYPLAAISVKAHQDPYVPRKRPETNL